MVAAVALTCAAVAVAQTSGDLDGDAWTDGSDNCPTVANADQIDADTDGVGDECDNCRAFRNPRLGTQGEPLRAPWQTTTGGQLDADADGVGNRCDGDHTAAGEFVGANDVVALRAAIAKSRDSADACDGRPCAVFDLDNAGAFIGSADMAIQRRLAGTQSSRLACAACPLECVGPGCAQTFEASGILQPVGESALTGFTIASSYGSTTPSSDGAFSVPAGVARPTLVVATSTEEFGGYAAVVSDTAPSPSAGRAAAALLIVDASSTAESLVLMNPALALIDPNGYPALLDEIRSSAAVDLLAAALYSHFEASTDPADDPAVADLLADAVIEVAIALSAQTASASLAPSGATPPGMEILPADLGALEIVPVDSDSVRMRVAATGPLGTGVNVAWVVKRIALDPVLAPLPFFVRDYDRVFDFQRASTSASTFIIPGEVGGLVGAVIDPLGIVTGAIAELTHLSRSYSEAEISFATPGRTALVAFSGSAYGDDEELGAVWLDPEQRLAWQSAFIANVALIAFDSLSVWIDLKTLKKDVLNVMSTAVIESLAAAVVRDPGIGVAELFKIAMEEIIERLPGAIKKEGLRGFARIVAGSLIKILSVGDSSLSAASRLFGLLANVTPRESAEVRWGEFCGDGIRQTSRGEQCDRSDRGGATCESRGYDCGGALRCRVTDCMFDVSACSTVCCGDETCAGGESCGTCPSDCCTSVCGNGSQEAGEGCDDGNANSGDCCSSSCQVEPSGSQTCGIGACFRTQERCADGELVDCVPLPAGLESTSAGSSCTNGIDDDCDGATDSGDPGCAVQGVTLTTNVLPPGAGSITPSCSSGCSYGVGSQVSVQATATSVAPPNPSFLFAVWTGDAVSASPSIVVAMNSPKSVTAHFACIETESNDTSPFATAVSRIGPCSGAILGRIASGSDVDWFDEGQVTPANTALRFRLDVPPGVDFDLEIYGPSPSCGGAQCFLRESTEGAGVDEVVELTTQANGYFAARVIGYQGASSTEVYTLRIE